MFDEYQQQVLAAYKKMKEERLLSHGLSNPTLANLRDECLAVYADRPYDAAILKQYFEDRFRGTQGFHPEGKLDIDKFKPVKNFLNGKTTRPNSRVVELVAWLIDFKPRPFQSWANLETSNRVIENLANLPIGAEVGEEPDHKKGEETKVNTPKPNNPFLSTIAHQPKVFGILLSLFAIVFLGFGYYKTTVERQKCMFWNGDHYEAVDCDSKMSSQPIVALDSEKVNHLKKITQPDTLTFNSVGKVWYSKIDNEVEFFTADGFHPIKTERRLKPVSLRIIDTYAKNNKMVK